VLWVETIALNATLANIRNHCLLYRAKIASKESIKTNPKLRCASFVCPEPLLQVQAHTIVLNVPLESLWIHRKLWPTAIRAKRVNIKMKKALLLANFVWLVNIKTLKPKLLVSIVRPVTFKNFRNKLNVTFAHLVTFRQQPNKCHAPCALPGGMSQIMQVHLIVKYAHLVTFNLCQSKDLARCVWQVLHLQNLSRRSATLVPRENLNHPMQA
jgi:hypothetical protein